MVSKKLLQFFDVLHVVLGQIDVLLRHFYILLAAAVEALTRDQARPVHAIEDSQNVLVDQTLRQRPTLPIGASRQPWHIFQKSKGYFKVFVLFLLLLLATNYYNAASH